MLFFPARSKGNEQRIASDRTYGIRRLISLSVRSTIRSGRIVGELLGKLNMNAT
jgi:hypothetical protein